MHVAHLSQTTVQQVTSFTDSAGWDHLLVVIKGAFNIPDNGGVPQPVQPSALAMEDTYTGEPGFSAPLYENDFASHKGKCDVLFRAHAHSPQGKFVKSLDVAVQVGGMTKGLHVVGTRYWEKDLFLLRHSEPEPFVSMPLHYGLAFGGSVPYMDGDKTVYDTYAPNPVGTGYSQRKEQATLHGMPLPNLEVPGHPLTRPDEAYPAVALSPVARNFYPRYTYAGTYDQQWRDNTAPFLPANFDDKFFQCAPEDQQIPCPVGGESVRLIHLMPDRPDAHFSLPPLNTLSVKVLDRLGSVHTLQPVADTLCFEPDEGQFSVVWRTSMRLGHDGLHEVKIVQIEEKSA